MRRCFQRIIVDISNRGLLSCAFCPARKEDVAHSHVSLFTKSACRPTLCRDFNPIWLDTGLEALPNVEQEADTTVDDLLGDLLAAGGSPSFVLARPRWRLTPSRTAIVRRSQPLGSVPHEPAPRVLPMVVSCAFWG